MEPFIQVEDDIKLAIEITAERASLSGAEFASKLQRLIELCRLQGHRTAKSAITLQLVPYVPPASAELERATRPDAPVRTAKDNGYRFVSTEGKPRKVDDDGRAEIQRRARQARLEGGGRHPKGWIKLIASEYKVSDALIYNIIYADPEYQAVIKT